MKPDVFEIIIEKKNLDNSRIKPYQTDYGLTVEEYFFFENKPIAMISRSEVYHDKFDFEDSIVLNFNEIPNKEFRISLKNLINMLPLFQNAKLIYEMDCDQYPLGQIKSVELRIDEVLGEDLRPLNVKFRAFIYDV